MVDTLRERFAHLDLTFSVGGQISFDVFPRVSARVAEQRCMNRAPHSAARTRRQQRLLACLPEPRARAPWPHLHPAAIPPA